MKLGKKSIENGEDTTAPKIFRRNFIVNRERRWTTQRVRKPKDPSSKQEVPNTSNLEIIVRSVEKKNIPFQHRKEISGN